MWPPEALCDAAKRRLIAVMRRPMQRTKHFFAKRGKIDNMRAIFAFFAMIQERVSENEYFLHINQRFHR